MRAQGGAVGADVPMNVPLDRVAVVMISMAVFGGILPRFSATISISWKVLLRSICTKMVIGFVESFWLEITVFLLTSTVMESPSTWALS